MISLFQSTNNHQKKEQNSVYIKFLNSADIVPLLPTTPKTDEEIISIAESIRCFGLMNPICVYYDALNEEYQIISGERRFLAMKLLGRTRVLCRVVTSKETRNAIIIAENCLSRNSDCFRASAAVSFVMNDSQLSTTELAAKFGLPHAKIVNILKLANLTYEEKRLLLSGHFSERVCAEIAELDDYSTRLSIIRYLIENTPKLASATVEVKNKRQKRKYCGVKHEIIRNTFLKLVALFRRNGIKAQIKENATDKSAVYTITVHN